MIKETAEGKAFDVFNTLLMILLMVIMIYPVYYVIMASFSNNNLLLSNKGLLLKPMGFTAGAYKLAFNHPLLMNGYKNIFVIIALSLPLDLFMTVCCGYFLASKNVMFKKYIVVFIMFTMFFGGGLIPTFLNIKDLGLYNSSWSLIIPGCFSVYNALIAKTSIEEIPDSLIESAYIDGAKEGTILIRIIVPLIKATLAVLSLYTIVGAWNSWFPATLYIKDLDKFPLQVILRTILTTDNDILNASDVRGDTVDSYAETIKYAAIVISTVPILCIYPFLQKYFMKGVLIGAVKG